MSARTEHEAEREAALTRLRELCPPGATVYTILRHVSRSGMQRRISLYVLARDGKREWMQWLDGYASTACGFRIDRGADGKDGLVVGGCGMDMGFHLVYGLSARLYSDGFGCIGESCPSNDHSNGDRDYTPHDATPALIVAGERAPVSNYTHWHHDGGYALRQEWI